jgi:hypothetical protein
MAKNVILKALEEEIVSLNKKIDIQVGILSLYFYNILVG